MKQCCKITVNDRSAGQRRPRAFMVREAAVAVILGLVMSAAAFAKGGHVHRHHKDHSHEDRGEKSPASEMPSSYGAAVLAIDGRLKNIEGLIDTKKLDAVHSEAEVIREVAKTVAQLALKADSGVPKEAVKKINLTAKALADQFAPIDEARDSGNLEATKKVYQEMLALQGTLKKYVPDMDVKEGNGTPSHEGGGHQH